MSARTSVSTRVADGIGRVTLDRPDAMNAITVDLGRDLETALRDLGGRDDVAVIVVRGAGGNFCAGGDFREVERLRPGGPDALRPLFENFAAACVAVGEVRPPVIAACEGVAMAGGFELLQACDVVLVHDDAKLCDNHVNYGQVPGGGSTQRLPRLVGRQRALGVLLSGDRLGGRDAVALGLAYRSYAADEFEVGVETFVTTMAGRRPEALATIKHLVRTGLEGTLADGLDAELDAVVTHIAGEAGGAGVSSFSTRSSA